jgi:hypothetical protein
MLDDHFQFKMFKFSIILKPFDGRIRLTSYLHVAHAQFLAHAHRNNLDHVRSKLDIGKPNNLKFWER